MAIGTQIAVRLEQDALDQIDQLVQDQQFGSRAEAVRHAVDQLLDTRRRAAIGAQIAEGYRRHPQTDEEEAQAVANLAALIAEDPW
ncbi:hypothetical protein BH23ACT9_BH23ACT9_14580 [soil metagenome]